MLPLLLLALMSGARGDPVNLIYQPYATGPEVVESVIDVLRENCILPDDHLFLRRLAYVETRDGTEPQTYRSGYYGGIWQIEQNMFQQTMNGGAALNAMYNRIKDTLGIDWRYVRWQDLTKPLYSGLAAALYVTLQSGSAGIPFSTARQETLWHSSWPNPTRNFNQLISIMGLGCHGNNQIDLVLILDSSSSVALSNFETAKRFLNSIVANFTVGPGAVRVALIRYATSVDVIFGLDSYTSLPEVQTAIANTAYVPANTNTAGALNAVVDSIFRNNNSRNRVKVVILVTDGLSDDNIDTRHAADRMTGITVLAIGVGQLITDFGELNYVATKPSCTHTFTVGSYDQIDAITQEIQKTACRAPLFANWTVNCTLPHCPPYAFPITSSGITITGSISCGSANVYVAQDNPYPSSAYSSGSLNLVPGTTVNLFQSESRTEEHFLYVNVPSTYQTAANQNCVVTLTPTVGQISHETTVYCLRQGQQIKCPLEVLIEKFGYLCKDTWRYPFPNPCTPDNIRNNKLKFFDPFDNTKFFKCDYAGSVYVVQCPPGEVYDPDCEVCYGPDNIKPADCSTPIDSSSMCSKENILKDLMFHADPQDERCFYHCDVWGKAWHQCCSGDEFWKQDKVSCEWRIAGPNPCGSLDTPIHKRFFPYPDDCHKYIMCNDDRDPLLESCGPNMRWDDTELTCVPGTHC